MQKTLFKLILQVRSACVQKLTLKREWKGTFLGAAVMLKTFLGKIVMLTTFLGAHKKRVHLWDWDPSLQAEAKESLWKEVMGTCAIIHWKYMHLTLQSMGFKRYQFNMGNYLSDIWKQSGWLIVSFYTDQKR